MPVDVVSVNDAKIMLQDPAFARNIALKTFALDAEQKLMTCTCIGENREIIKLHLLHFICI